MVTQQPPLPPQQASPLQQLQHSITDSDPVDDDINASLWTISGRLKRFKPTKDSTVEDIDNHMNDDEVVAKHLPHADKKDVDGQTLLHLLLKVPPGQFQEYLLHFQWVMWRYPKLYQTGIQEKNSVLHYAQMRCQKAKDKAFLSNLVILYPSQVVDILKLAEDKEELLAGIMPFIRTSAGPGFLELFGKGVKELEPKQVTPIPLPLSSFIRTHPDFPGSPSSVLARSARLNWITRARTGPVRPRSISWRSERMMS
jgi:hypothetical protein